MNDLRGTTLKTLPIPWSRSEYIANAAVLGLCVFSVANPLVKQAVLFFFPFPIAGLNLMQWFQGLCFLLVLMMLPVVPRGCIELSRPFSRLLWAYVIALSVVHLRLLSTGRIPADMVFTERMVYFKIVFALLFWYYASRLVQSYEFARVLLHSILLGALISAGWILVCYCSGIGGAHYAFAGITATAGSEGASGKGVVGFLLPAAAGAMFLSLRDGSYRWALSAALIVAAVFVTFDRSAQVAFVVALFWMAIWWLGLARPRPASKIVFLFLGIIVLSGAIYYGRHGTEELLARWTLDFDRGEIGSGRGAFYTAAWNWFWHDSSITDFLLGMGYVNIWDVMHTASGAFRHTHSDLFDMLMIGGIVGLALYFLLFHTIASLGRGLPIGSAEFATLGAVLLSFGVMSLLTGLMAFPHAMYAFGAQCICIRILAIQGDIDPGHSVSVHPDRYARVGFRNSKSMCT